MNDLVDDDFVLFPSACSLYTILCLDSRYKMSFAWMMNMTFSLGHDFSPGPLTFISLSGVSPWWIFFFRTNILIS